MTITEALEIVDNGCDHPPRVGGWCLPCDEAIRALGLEP